MFKYINCIDVNTRYCPCELAEFGECLVCPMLKGKSCDCIHHSGSCIFQEFTWNNKKARTPRQFQQYPIQKKEYLREDLLLLEISTKGSELATELSRIGAFVFLKKPGLEDTHAAPISVMKVNPAAGTISLAIKLLGVKTKRIAEAEQTIMVKGPYWNGIQGQKFLMNPSPELCLIIGRGIGMAPAVLAAEKLVAAKSEVFAILGRGRSEKSCFEEYFKELGCITQQLELMNRKNIINENDMNLISQIMQHNNIKTVLLAGSDLFQKRCMQAISSRNVGTRFATVNNALMCCGEGCCGSCESTLGTKTGLKTCKAQYNPLEYFSERQEL